MHSVICSGLGSLECFVITKCTKFGQLILRKIRKLLKLLPRDVRLKCDFSWGSAPDPAVGAYSASPDLLAGFKGPTSKGREGGEGEREGKGGKGRGKEEGKGMEGKAFPLL